MGLGLQPWLARITFGLNDHAVTRLEQRHHIVVATYHRVGNAEQLWPDPPGMAEATVEQFEAQMDWIGQRCNPITLEQTLQVAHGKDAFPNRAVLVTFDDGYIEDLQRVLPALRRNNIRPVVFLPTAYVGTRLRFWWDRVGVCLQTTSKDHLVLPEAGMMNLPLSTAAQREEATWRLLTRARGLRPEAKEQFLAGLERELEVGKTSEADRPVVVGWDDVQRLRADMDFGAHTETHPLLSSLSAEEARAEMAGSKSVVEEKLQIPCHSFAIPYGDSTAYTSQTLHVASQVGFSLVFTLEESLRNLRWQGGAAIMDRMTFDQRDGVTGMAAKITWPRVFIPDWIGKLRGLLPR